MGRIVKSSSHVLCMCEWWRFTKRPNFNSMMYSYEIYKVFVAIAIKDHTIWFAEIEVLS